MQGEVFSHLDHDLFYSFGMNSFQLEQDLGADDESSLTLQTPLQFISLQPEARIGQRHSRSSAGLCGALRSVSWP